ncbi:MAG: prepilin-type N-terminal cleavage/methylation domain-containing protein, partial [Candidatus Hydrogenedentes bacterium]|nr:prepilin-type N-terminal cleavage/methylation domain-containing protein [Candidatus Hydrogenedentota bacterium]
MKRWTTRGFTLIELLVVIAILSVVTTLGTMTLVQLWARWGELKSASTLDARADRIFAQMHDDFSAAVASTIAGTALQGTSATAKDKQFYELSLASDRFTLPVELATANGKATVLAGYHIERANGQSTLIRTEQALRGDGGPAVRALAEGVVQMRVEYAGAGGAWTDNWSQPGNPAVVRVSLLLAEPERPDRQQVAGKAVFTV